MRENVSAQRKPTKYGYGTTETKSTYSHWKLHCLEESVQYQALNLPEIALGVM